MPNDDEAPRYRVRVSGYGPPPKVTKIRWNRSGGRYDGRPDVEFGAVTIRAMSFAGMHFEQFSAEGTKFVNCDFSGARLEGWFGVRRQTRFEDCLFDGTRMSDVEPGQARFVRCQFSAVTIRGWNAAANEFIDCRFAGLIKQCNFWGRPAQEWMERMRPARPTNEFRGNDFRAAELIDVSFKGGIEISAQRWPDSPDYIRLDRLRTRIELARPVLEAWQEPARADGVLMLDVYSKHGYEVQDELFAHRWDLGLPRAVADRVWALLESVL